MHCNGVSTTVDPFWDISLHIGTTSTSLGSPSFSGGMGDDASVFAGGGEPVDSNAAAAALLINPSVSAAPTVLELSSMRQKIQGMNCQYNII